MVSLLSASSVGNRRDPARGPTSDIEQGHKDHHAQDQNDDALVDKAHGLFKANDVEVGENSRYVSRFSSCTGEGRCSMAPDLL